MASSPPATALTTPSSITSGDTVTDITWHISINQFSVSMWNGSVWQWTEAWGGPAPKQWNSELIYQAPTDSDYFLCCAYAFETQQLCWGGASGTLYTCGDGKSIQQIPRAHDAPISCLNGAPKYVVTGSWDFSFRVWGLSGGSVVPQYSVKLSQRVFAMDLRLNRLALALAPESEAAVGKVAVFDLSESSPPTFVRELNSPLKFQSRSVALFADIKGFLLGSIEGRCAIVHIPQSLASDDFIFKCHRDQDKKLIYSVTCISVHPLGTFATAGGDGGMNFWDKDARTRIKPFPLQPAPMTSGKFSPSGTLFAFATGNDWAQGTSSASPIPQLFVLNVVGDMTPKKKKK